MARNRFVEYRPGVEWTRVVDHGTTIAAADGTIQHLMVVQVACTPEVANLLLNFLRAGGAEITGEILDCLPAEGARLITKLEAGDEPAR